MENTYYEKYLKYKTKYLIEKDKHNNMYGGGKCQKSNLTKYKNRPSPPFPANDCKNEKKLGNDGQMYKSTPDKNNIYKWVLLGNKQPTSSKNGSIIDFVKLIQNVNFTLNPKVNKNLNLPNTFSFNKQVSQIITIEENIDITSIFKIKNNQVNILEYLSFIYKKHSKDSSDHVFLEEINEILKGNTLYIYMYFGS